MNRRPLPSMLLKMVVIGAAVLPVFVSSAFGHADHSAHPDAIVEILKGQSIELNLREICESELAQCDGKTLTVAQEPTEGVIFSNKDSDIVRYQHAGTSTSADYFVFTAKSAQGTPQNIVVSFTISTDRPTITIISPTSGASVKPGDVDILFYVEGIGVDHVHLALSDDEHVSVSPDATSYTFENVEAGSYTLTASLASSSHRDIANTQVTVPVVVAE